MAVTLTVRDLSPRFLAFYEKALDADPESRWALFQEHYNFAAVPPTEQGRQMARRALDENFHRYPEALELIRQGAAGFRPEVGQVVEAVSQALDFDQEMEIQVVFFVGMFDKNAFQATLNGKYLVNLPLEGGYDRTPYVVAHELTHALHAKLSNDPGGWIRSIAVSMMQEGLAVWTSRAVFPGYSDEEYLGAFSPGWYGRCRAADRAILEGIRPHLAEASQEALQRFILGPGPAGLDREVYWAGWRAVGHLLEQGHSLGRLARLTEAEATPLLDRALAELLEP
ncbi:MAG: hypothetical protein ACOY93_18645 [Bacillota bacterium]